MFSNVFLATKTHLLEMDIFEKPQQTKDELISSPSIVVTEAKATHSPIADRSTGHGKLTVEHHPARPRGMSSVELQRRQKYLDEQVDLDTICHEKMMPVNTQLTPKLTKRFAPEHQCKTPPSSRLEVFDSRQRSKSDSNLRRRDFCNE